MTTNTEYTPAKSSTALYLGRNGEGALQVNLLRGVAFDIGAVRLDQAEELLLRYERGLRPREDQLLHHHEKSATVRGREVVCVEGKDHVQVARKASLDAGAPA